MGNCDLPLGEIGVKSEKLEETAATIDGTYRIRSGVAAVELYESR